MTRYGRPVDEVRLKNQLNTGLQRSDKLMVWEAAIAAGASLDELQKIEEGKYPNWFLSRMVVWYVRHNQYQAHVSEAESDYLKKKSKRK